MSDGKLFLSDNLNTVRPLLQNIFLFFGTSHESEIEIFFYNSEKKTKWFWIVECNIEIMSDEKFAFLLL